MNHLMPAETAAELAVRRNEFVATLADEVFIAHATVGGHLEKLTRHLCAWVMPEQMKIMTTGMLEC